MTNKRTIGWWVQHIVLLVLYGVLLQGSAFVAWHAGVELFQGNSALLQIPLALFTFLTCVWGYLGQRTIRTMQQQTP